MTETPIKTDFSQKERVLWFTKLKKYRHVLSLGWLDSEAPVFSLKSWLHVFRIQALSWLCFAL